MIYPARTRRCSFPDCGKPHESFGLCQGHRTQQKKGKSLTPLFSSRKPNNAPPRIEYREVACPVAGLDGPCHQWLRYTSKKGYGQVRAYGKTVPVHCYIWSQANGPIPAGMVLDHRCKNRACCNVSHLRLVTPRVNALENSDGIAAKFAARTHCKNGHPFDEASVKSWSDGTRRVCSLCKRQYMANYQKQRRAQRKGA